MYPSKSRTLNVAVPEPDLLTLDALADRLGMSKTRLVRTLIDFGLGRLSEVFPQLAALPPDAHIPVTLPAGFDLPQRAPVTRLTTVQVAVTPREQAVLDRAGVRISAAARSGLQWVLKSDDRLRTVLESYAPPPRDC